MKPFTSFSDDQELYFVFYTIFSSVTVWLAILLAVASALIPDIVLAVIVDDLGEKRLLAHLEKTKNSFFKYIQGRNLYNTFVVNRNVDLGNESYFIGPEIQQEQDAISI